MPSELQVPMFLTMILNLVPIRIAHQALFAEAFSQGLASEMEIDQAIEVATITCKSPRLRRAMLKVASSFRTGETLSDSLSQTGIWVSKRFQAALNVGENRGMLDDELVAFARTYSPNVTQLLAISVGRSTVVMRFAKALSRLLRQHPLTIDIIQDAAAVAAGKGTGFDLVIDRLIEDLKSGESFALAMKRQTPTFDPFFSRLVEVCKGRECLCRTLNRMTGGDPLPRQPIIESDSTGQKSERGESVRL